MKPKILYLVGTGDYSSEVIDEPHFQTNLFKICSNRMAPDSECNMEATLIQDDTHPYDTWAVKVMIKGLQVGYLNRDCARYFRNTIKASGYDGYDVICKAVIRKGPANDSIHRFNVILDMPQDYQAALKQEKPDSFTGLSSAKLPPAKKSGCLTLSLVITLGAAAIMAFLLI